MDSEVGSDIFYLKHLNLEMLPEFDVDEYLLIRRRKEELHKKKDKMTVRRVRNPFRIQGPSAGSFGNYHEPLSGSDDNAVRNYEDKP